MLPLPDKHGRRWARLDLKRLRRRPAVSGFKGLNDDIGALVRALRHRRRLTQAVLAPDLQITARQLSRIERGRASISLPVFLLLCWRLRVSPRAAIAALQLRRKGLRE